MRQFQRSDRVAEQIRRVISQVWATEISPSLPGMVTFTHVRLSRDLQHATVYYSFLGQPEALSAVEDYLERERRSLRHKVGQELKLRQLPELDFKFDPSVEEGIRIEKLLDEIKDKRQD